MEQGRTAVKTVKIFAYFMNIRASAKHFDVDKKKVKQNTSYRVKKYIKNTPNINYRKNV